MRATVGRQWRKATTEYPRCGQGAEQLVVEECPLLVSYSTPTFQSDSAKYLASYPATPNH